MYARLCDIEILSSYINEVSVGDLLTVQALVTNPLDWQHFYEKISTIKKGDKTDFMVVTQEGDRLQGTGDIKEVDRWSNQGRYGFKVKISVKKQKSLTDRRTRAPKKAAMLQQPVLEKKMLEMTPPATAAEAQQAAAAAAAIAPYGTVATAAAAKTEDVAAFREMLKGSLAMDMSA